MGANDEGRTALWFCALEIRDKPDRRDDYAEIARLLIDSGADPDHLDDEGRSPRTLAPDTMRTLQDERDRAVTTAAVAASIMSGLCGENFIATPWMLSRIQPMPKWVAFGASLRGRAAPGAAEPEL